MGKKQRRYDDLMRALQAKLDAYTNTPSATENLFNNEITATTNFLNSRDYRNLPNGVNINMLPLAEQQRMRQMTRGSIDTGQGQINPNILAAQREVSDNEFAQDWGNEYENKVGELQGRRDTLAGMVQGMYDNRMNAGIQGGQMQIQNQLNRPKGFNWLGLLTGGLQGAGSVLSGLGSMGYGRN